MAKKPTEWETRWGKISLAAGFTMVPTVLIHRMGSLGLKPTEFCVLMVIISYWIKTEQPPHPSVETIAASLAVDARTVRRAITALIKKDLIIRQTRVTANNGNKTNLYYLTPLVDRLKPYAGEHLTRKRAKRDPRRNARLRQPEPDLAYARLLTESEEEELADIEMRKKWPGVFDRGRG